MNLLKLRLIFFAILTTTILVAQENRIKVNDKDVFASGMNLAWMNFAADLPFFNEETFTQQLDALSQAGGNSMRWWLHINGTRSPQWDGNMVSGLRPAELENLKLALDLAEERNIALILCLWSFDMLNDNAGSENFERNKYFLTNEEAIQSYIDHALIPMVNAAKGHKAILCWEIFNEPEGMTTEFGWTPEKVQMKDVQKFVNLCAGAIHRSDSNAMVSNGSWSFRASSDIWNDNVEKNYYSDKALIAEGKDTSGYLDFYMVHYYDWGGEKLSPFHHPVSHWELDKPVVIAEFSAIGPIKGVTTKEAYTYLYENGYAGSLSWTMTNHDGHGGIQDATPGLMHLYLNHTDDIVIPMGDNNQGPKVKSMIPAAYLSRDTGMVLNYHNLNEIFFDYEDSTNLIYTIYSATGLEMVSTTINKDSYIDINVLGTDIGESHVEIKATDSGGKSAITGFDMTIYDPAKMNLAYKKPVEASTSENTGNHIDFVNDGLKGTRWSSLYEDDQYVIIDLEQEHSIGTINLFWETAYTKEYNIEVSMDQSEWALVYETTESKGGDEIIDFKAAKARYVKFNLIKRATSWGNSLYEIEIYAKEPSVGINNNNASSLKLYPNPSKGEIFITLDGEHSVKHIQIIDMQGKEVFYQSKVDSKQISIDGLLQGLYVVRVTDTNNKTYLQKIISE